MDLHEQELVYWRSKIREYLNTEIDRLRLSQLPDILDIGVGESTVIIREKIPHLKCLDHTLSIEAAEYRCDICNNNDIPLDKFDAIFCVEVLEHTQYPWVVANNLTNMLKPNGYLIVTVPSLFFYHPLNTGGFYGDYWRFMPEYTTFLFPRLKCRREQAYSQKEHNLYPTGIGATLHNIYSHV
jgi:SAM-dependent methyltransferase